MPLTIIAGTWERPPKIYCTTVFNKLNKKKERGVKANQKINKHEVNW
jgi:hypothetical protein